ncbi:MAG: hypothetical protein HW403_814 [Dehalococcoidia bacterium]|nr:hypothetical protein [Dehalococcoidia bacterium]
MEFAIQYTKEQEDFRKEVRAWLEVTAKRPPELGAWPVNERDTTVAQREWENQFRRKLGHQGWLFATMPKEVGGGGLSIDHDIIIKEELKAYDADVATGGTAIAGMYIYGTEQQKEKLLKPLLMGETTFGNLWTEPDCGVDLASVKTRATKDGDDFIINGVKCYISSVNPDMCWLLAVTDPDAPRHANLGHFFMPNHLPGITWQLQELINRGTQHFVFFDNVRVPREYLIGGETQGWQVAQSALELEHGAAGALFGRTEVVEDLVEAWSEGKVHSLAHGDAAKEHLVDAYIRYNIHRLIARRNFWMFRAKQPMSYHGSQNVWYGRETRIRTSEDLLSLLGPHSLVEDKEWGLLGGRVEHAQRNGSMATHAAGSYEIDKVIIARRIGMSRTHESAAPTH